MESRVSELVPAANDQNSHKVINIDATLLKTLSQIGYMACMKGMPNEGEMIMESLTGLKPQTPPIVLGLAFAKITLMKFTDAEKLIREVLANDANNLTAKCFLGITLFGLGDREQANVYFADIQANGNEDQKAIAVAYMSVEE
ncbi:MAG: tetratricopeptide repeat protein [Gammaproteobacteria bacterium]